ncbi:MAG: hypothetical protein V1645_00020 [archaeon]
MKKSLVALAVLVLVFSLLPVTANVTDPNTGGAVDIDITTERFEPMVWLCDSRIMYDDNIQPGRISDSGEELVERLENYAFEGEKIHWTVLVIDKNGIDKVKDVFITVDTVQGPHNPIEANCRLVPDDLQEGIPESCNARIGEEEITEFNNGSMGFYDCLFTVETPESMDGEYWVTVEAEDLDGLSSIMAENEFWFFNPVIALTIEDGPLSFSNVLPGSQAYSNTLAVGNGADPDSGVLLDMFVTGTDFYDSSSSGALCPITNQLALTNFDYYATNGAYTTQNDGRDDAEGYVPICYGDKFTTGVGSNSGNGNDGFYENCEIMQGVVNAEGYYAGNVLTPGAEIAMTFRLSVPEPCNGDFDSGQIFFWGEAI